MAMANHWLQDRETKVEFFVSDNSEAPLQIMIKEHAKPVM
jgi:hypothetical protein